jgi:peroxiredoxin/uncharacterized membrane protein YphA (DoxX/SURF4 family)
MSTAVLALRLIVAAVFAVAAVGKLLDLAGSRQAMRDFGVPSRLAGPFGLLLPLAEAAAAAALVIRPSAQWGALVALLLLLAFIAGIGNALRQGVTPDCHCFGQIQSAPAGRETLVRNALLAAMSIVVLGWGPGPAVDTWFGARSTAELVAIATAAAAVVAVALALRLRQRMKRMQDELATAQRMAAAAPPGIPVGSPAPDFELPSLREERVSLESVLAEGLPALLVFVSPTCSSCAEVLPKLGRWQKSLADRLRLVIVSTGSAGDNRVMADQGGLTDLLLQEKAEIIEAYRIRGTPSAVLVSPDGSIASNPAETVFGIEPLIRLALRRGSAAPLQGSIA